jgi:uncharacterized membrane protein
MTMLIAAAATFFGIHLVISGTKLRDVIVHAIGESLYRGLFSLGSLAAIVWLCIAYKTAFAIPDNRILFEPAAWAREELAVPVMALAFLVAVPGLFTPNPGAVGQQGKVVEARGIVRVTRHPFLWGVGIWAGFHLYAAGDLASTIFFGTFLAVALLGTLAIDAKRRRKHAPSWQAFAAETSNLPFLAIVSGRNRFSAREYFDWRFLIALAVFGVMFFLHTRLFGIAPLNGF